MALSQQVSNVTAQNIGVMDGEILEKVILENDLSKLSSVEKVIYVKQVCGTLGLNPATRPFQLLKFNGKEVLYATKDATEQLRYTRGVSIKSLETKILQDSLYVVTANATMPDGRSDSSTGVISISGLKGDALSNAMMKAETKAKRRATLSICGLGFMDESETDSIPNARKVSIDDAVEIKGGIVVLENSSIRDIEKDVQDVSWAGDIETLQNIFTPAYKHWISIKHKDNLQKLMDAKNKRKQEIENETSEKVEVTK